MRNRYLITHLQRRGNSGCTTNTAVPLVPIWYAYHTISTGLTVLFVPNWDVESPPRSTGSRERRVRLPKLATGDRRAHARYPLGLALRYAVLHRGRQTETGLGQTVDLSSSGLCFAADRPLEPGGKIELAISWPLLLDGGVQLQLVALGTVVWSNGTEAGLEIEHHEFRTRGAGLKP